MESLSHHQPTPRVLFPTPPPRQTTSASSSPSLDMSSIELRETSSFSDDGSSRGGWSINGPPPQQGFTIFQETVSLSTNYLDEERHQPFRPPRTSDTPVTWRLKERMKTVSVALVLCLNLGTDPPDVVKASPCGRKQCWFDPRSTNKAKAIEIIGNNLQQQYERWQARAKYKQALDPTMDDVKKLCASLRRNAKVDRFLFHYNGHGVPRPTSAGEIWVFNKTYTQYIPLSIYDLRAWVGTPAIYVLDCSGAGILLPHFLQNPVMSARQAINGGLMRDGLDGSGSVGGGGGSGPSSSSTTASSALPSSMTHRDCIVLAPCAANELLPTNPKFPADIFTACLTTPILVALRWFITQNRLSIGDLDPDFVDQIPGKLSDRKTPLGELNWVFTAITDTIAWNTLPSPVFQRLFRQDLLVASLFRNFLLADRILRSFNCTPTSIPRLASTAQHPLWQAWDLAAECCLSQLIADRNPTISGAETRLSAIPFFADQLTAFEVWLEFSHTSDKPPEQLPVVLQVLLSQAHRLRALLLLRRFLDLGPWAVNLALSVGIFPYVLKLLQSPAPELRQVLVCIWARILAFDPSCRTDLVKDNAYLYFIVHLSGSDVHPDQRVMAAFILTVIMDDSRSGQRDCLKKNVHKTCAQFLFQRETEDMPVFRRWLCFCIGKLCFEHPDGRMACIREEVHLGLFSLMSSPHVEVRAAAIYTLGTLLGVMDPLRSGGTGNISNTSSSNGMVSSTSNSSMVFLNISMNGQASQTSTSSSSSRQWSGIGLASTQDSDASRRIDVSVIGLELLRVFDDASPMVRREAILALFLLIADPSHLPYFAWVAHELGRFNAERLQRQQQPQQQQQQSQGIKKDGSGGGGGAVVPASSSSTKLAAGGISWTDSLTSSTGSLSNGLMIDDDVDDDPQHLGTPTRGGKATTAGGGNGERALVKGNSNNSKGSNGTPAPTKAAGPATPGVAEWYRGLANRLRKQGGEIAEHYLCIWLAIRQLHHKESFPPAADVASHIVHVVHERILDMNLDPSEPAPFPGSSYSPPSSRHHHSPPYGNGSSPPLANHQGRRPGGSLRPTQPTGHYRGSSGGAIGGAGGGGGGPAPPHPPSLNGMRGGRSELLPPPSVGAHQQQSSGGGGGGGPLAGGIPPRLPLERAVSANELQRSGGGAAGVAGQHHHHPSNRAAGDGMLRVGPAPTRGAALLGGSSSSLSGNQSAGIPGPPGLARHHSLAVVDEAGQVIQPKLLPRPSVESASLRWLRTQYQEANLYAWSKRHFSAPAPLSSLDDPLSPEGQLKIYRHSRNRQVLQEAEQLALNCASILGVPEDEEPDLLEGMDALLSVKPPTQPSQRKSQCLKLHQKAIFESDAEMTSLLVFHPFESILVSTDDHSTVRVWNYEEGKKIGAFKNDTQKASRVTSVGWLNEATSSLLLTGSDDGVIRVWNGVLNANWSPPQLVTAFYAHALAGRGSGLVTKWVHGSGLLITGGSSDRIRAWDLRREQIVRDWQTEGDACVTILTANTPRASYEMNGGSNGQSMRPGPSSIPSSTSLVVSGFGNGKVKIYDLRMDKPVAVLQEHQNWIVLTDFIKGERELLTGSLTGEMRFWDLRRTGASLKMMDVGKGPMTAMAVHHTCPMMASGSYNQFIKVLTLDGDTVNVIRYHDGILGQRIGPVATLAFHPCKLLLAAGAADSIISIYSPQMPLAQ